VVSKESGLEPEKCAPLVNLATRIRSMKDQDLEEGASTRLLVYCAILIRSGMTALEAARAALIEPLSDDDDVKEGLEEVVQATFG